MKEKIRFMYCF